MRFGVLLGAAVMASSGAVVTGIVGSAGVAVAVTSGPAYTCTGGDIPSGNYASITVTGVCEVPADGTAVIHIAGNLNVAPGALLDAQSSPSTITVGHNVTAGAGSLLGLGCQSNFAQAPHPCVTSDGASAITVYGNVTATGANTVLLNGITVDGNVTLTGGGGVFPWPEKHNTILGNLSISGVTPEWLGVLFSNIGGNATLTNITATDPGDAGFAAVSVAGNTVGRNLNCTGLGPRLTGVGSNTVGHNATGQCAS